MVKTVKVELSLDLVNKLCKEGSIGMTVEDVIRSMYEHTQTCDPWVNRK